MGRIGFLRQADCTLSRQPNEENGCVSRKLNLLRLSSHRQDRTSSLHNDPKCSRSPHLQTKVRGLSDAQDEQIDGPVLDMFKNSIVCIPNLNKCSRLREFSRTLRQRLIESVIKMALEISQPVWMFNSSFRNHVEYIELAFAGVRKGKCKADCMNGR